MSVQESIAAWHAAILATREGSPCTASFESTSSGPALFGADFLADPERLPELLGEPWGAEPITLAVAGCAVRFTGFAPRQAEVLRRRFGPLFIDPAAECGSPAVEIRVHRAAAESFHPQDAKRLDVSLDLLYERHGVTLAGLFLVGRLHRTVDPHGRLGASIWLPPGEPRHLVWAFENVLRVVLAYRLVQLGGALLHGAALRHDAGVDVCYGPSGIGKTTLSRRGSELGLEVLSDDLNLVTPSADGFAVHQLPYAGLFGRAGLLTDGYPLHALYRLGRHRPRGAGELSLETQGAAQAIGSLLTCAPFVNGDPWWRDRLLSGLLAIADVAWPARLGVSLESDLSRLPGWERT